MIFFVSFILLVGSIDVIVAQGNAKFTRCDQLPKQYIEYEWLTKLSPFYIFQGKAPVHHCSQIVYAKPDYNRHDHTGTAIFIQGSHTFSYQLTLVNNTIWNTVLCTNGFKNAYPNVYTNFKTNHSALCVANCAGDGINYNDILCFGRSPADEVAIKNFVDTTLKGVPDIVNMQSGCNKPKNCDLVI